MRRGVSIRNTQGGSLRPGKVKPPCPARVARNGPVGARIDAAFRPAIRASPKDPFDGRQQEGSFFVTRLKSNSKFRRLYSLPVDRASGVICDQLGELTGFYSQQGYPERLRRIRYRDSEDRRLIFLTNHLSLPSRTVCELYRLRWQVELFFKWIKQHLRIKSFFGTSENAVKTQVWIAVSIYVLVAIARKRLDLKPSLYSMLQILSVTPFEKVPLLQLLTEATQIKESPGDCNQLILF